MRELDVRRALYAKVLDEHVGRDDTRVLDELGLANGDARVDVAVVNGFLHGYEIKSAKDTLERLPHQIEVYSAILDRVTLVVYAGHLDKALAAIPAWWGVKQATSGARGAVHFEEVRRPHLNQAIDPRALVTLLWSNEVLALLEERGLARGVRGRARRFLYDRLAGAVPLDELRSIVRARLKARKAWNRRADGPRP